MTRLSEFSDQLRRITDGDPWYGDPVARVLSGLTASQAAARPIANAHTIWELVLHLTAWVREVRRRLVEGDWRVPADGDWPVPPAPAEAAWREAVAALERAHAELIATLRTWPDERLDETLGSSRDRALGTGVTYAQMLHGVLQHDAYHLGQIALLRRALPA